MRSSKITSNYRVTIPKDVRKILKIKAGDFITFEILENGLVAIRKSMPLDIEYLKTLNYLLKDWE